VSFLFGSKQAPAAPAPIVMPTMPTAPSASVSSTANIVAEEKAKIRSGSKKKTILTSPQGIEIEANTKRPTLLGV